MMRLLKSKLKEFGGVNALDVRAVRTELFGVAVDKHNSNRKKNKLAGFIYFKTCAPPG